MTEYYPQLSSFATGLACACPQCGQGKLYKGLLETREACDACGLDFSRLDSQDGAAFFIIVLYSAVVIPAALWLEFALEPPFWVHIVLWVPIVIGGSILLLRPLKAWMLAQQFKHNVFSEDAPD
ncbi:MAG: DUF983 domain-containing protein [Alphaproteobacteria bacterium]